MNVAPVNRVSFLHFREIAVKSSALFSGPRRLMAVACLIVIAVGIASGQLPTTGWPRGLGNAQNSGLSAGYGAMPVIRWKVIPAGAALCPRIGPDGTLYTSITTDVLSGAGYLTALSPKDGSTLWNSPTGIAPIMGTLDITGEWVGPYGPKGELGAVSTTTGKLLWYNPAAIGPSLSPEFRFPIAISESGEIFDSLSYFGPDLDAFSNTGAQLWSSTGTHEAYGGPAIGPDGTLYYPSYDGNVYARRPSDGGIVWNTNVLSNAPNQFASPCVLGSTGLVYVEIADNKTHVFVIALDDSSGHQKWTVDLGAFSQLANSAMCIGPNGDLYVGGNNGDILALDGTTGAVVWDTVVQSPETVAGLACAGDGTLYAAGTSAVYAVDSHTGSVVWNFQLSSGDSLVTDGLRTGVTHSTLNCLAVAQDGSLAFATTSAIYCLESIHVAKLSISPGSVVGGQTATGSLTLNMVAPSGGFSVNLTSSGSIISVPSAVTVPSGATSVTFIVSTVPVDADATQTVTIVPGINQTASLTILPPVLSGISLSPGTVPGGATSTGTVTLTGPAGPSGAIVALKSDSKSATVPATVTVPPGKTTATFTVATSGVDSQTVAHITATWNSANFAQPLTITAATLASISLNPTSVQGGTASTGTVALAGIAGPSGSTVALKSSNPNVATGGTNVVVPAGKSAATFPITTIPVAVNATVQISGTLNSVTDSASLTVTAPTLVSLALNPTTVPAGSPSTGAVTISGPAASTGLAVALSSSLTSAAVPSSVTVASGATTATFTVTTTGVDASTSATITATLGGLKQTATLGITASTLGSVSLNPPSVLGGSSSTGTVTLTGPAGPSGAVVSLSSNSISAKVPGSVTIPSGKSSATFTVTTTGVNAQTTAVVSASFGSKTAQASLTTTPVQIATVAIAPTSVQGGTSATGTITLNGPAATGGTTVSLTSSNSSASVPASLTIAQGQTTGTFAIQTSAVSSPTTATVTALANGSSASASLTVTAPVLTAVTLNPTTLAGGGTSMGTVTLSGPASSGGAAVSLRSAVPSVAVPASVTIPAGSTSSTFTVSASAVTSQTTAAISASFGSVTKSVNLTLLPLTLSGVAVSPNRIQGGASGLGAVSLNGSAPSAGATVLLKSSLAGVKVPASVKILSGQSSASFTVTTIGTASEKSSTITATWGGTSVTTTVTLLPPTLTAVTLSPASVTGGTSSTGTVTLSGAAPTGGISLKLTSGSAAATVPASITVPAGKTSATFTVKTTAVASDTGTSISASLSGTSQSATLKILAPVLSSLVLKPASVIGGSSSTATVTLTGPAPKGGLTLTLGSSSASATVQATLVLASGKASGTFTVKTKKVTSQTTASISASLSSAKVSANLTIK